MTNVCGPRVSNFDLHKVKTRVAQGNIEQSLSFLLKQAPQKFQLQCASNYIASVQACVAQKMGFVRTLLVPRNSNGVSSCSFSFSILYMENSDIHHYTFQFIHFYTPIGPWCFIILLVCEKPMIFMGRSRISRTTLIDPVCFLVLKILVQGGQILRSYFSIDSGEMCANAGISPQMLETFSLILGVLSCFFSEMWFLFLLLPRFA